jgi:heterodisulfide reductase subunit A2
VHALSLSSTDFKFFMKHILVIGGGIAGMETSVRLSEMGFEVTLVEQEDKLGGKLNQWHKLFPDNYPAKDLLKQLNEKVTYAQIHKKLNTKVVSIQKTDDNFNISLNNDLEFKAEAIVLATGFEVFDARKKEEYGYGIYENVITSVDLEKIFRHGEMLKTSKGIAPRRVGIIHCVGSRDEKAGHSYCSQLCCITAMKQAIEIRKQIPACEVFCFYMDLRMFGRHFEDIYKSAQMDYGVQFIRGRLSESFENEDGSVMLKVEDTLLGKPLRMNVDKVILMTGMVPSKSNTIFRQMLNVKLGNDGFYNSLDLNYETISSGVPGVFVAGACKGPKTIENTINEACAAAVKVKEYLKN